MLFLQCVLAMYFTYYAIFQNKMNFCIISFFQFQKSLWSSKTQHLVILEVIFSLHYFLLILPKNCELY